jgi:hypothetical protein
VHLRIASTLPDVETPETRVVTTVELGSFRDVDRRTVGIDKFDDYEYV